MIPTVWQNSAKNPARRFRVRRFPSKLKAGMKKANDRRSAILTPLRSCQLTFEGNDRKFHSKVFIFFLTSLLSKAFNFFDTHEDVAFVPPRFS
jgi:hypothetical protein